MPTPPTTQIDPIHIFYPNGGNQAVQMYVWDGTKPVLWDGAVTFSGTITIGAITGNKSNNAVVPGSTNLGVLPAIANASSPSWTEGRQVLLSTDLSGNQRVALSAALPAGSNVIGHVITDATSTTIATQATAANLNATVVGTGTFAVQATISAGSAVIGHVITDTGSTTAVTGNVTVVQSTATSLKAQVVGAGVAGTPAGGVLTIQGDAGTVPIGINLTQINGLSLASAGSGVIGVMPIAGGQATNVAIGVNPVNIGAQAVSSENAAVTATRMVQLVADLAGKLIVLPYANPENFVSGAITSPMTSTTSTSLIGAPASGLRNYITQVTVSNSHATVGTDMILQDGSGGTTIYTIPAAAVYGGATLSFPTPLRQPTTATALFIANVTTGASTKASASGYKGA